MDIKIRPAAIRDIPAITKIYQNAVNFGLASFELRAPNEAEMVSRFNHIIKGNYPYLVAASGDEIAGYSYAGPYRTRPAYCWSVENSVYVDEKYQGNGVGIQLLAALIEACEERNYRQMIAVIGDSANQASIKLHEKLGFQITGTLKDVGRKQGKWLDSVIMQLTIGDGGSTDPKSEPY